MKIGFIGQGYVGNALANHYAKRGQDAPRRFNEKPAGYEVVRYSLAPEHAGNKDVLKDCGIVFICVPTPTVGGRFDGSRVEEALSLVSDNAITVIKSTVLPGTTRRLQKAFPRLTVMHSPEFLRARHAAHDTAYPVRNVMGIVDAGATDAAYEVLATMPPPALSQFVVTAEEAELAKYASNAFLVTKNVFANAIYDLAQKLDVDYGPVAAIMGADPRISPSHLDVDPDSRGAGGPCFIKDLAALVSIAPPDSFLYDIGSENLLRLESSRKDRDIVEKVYGPLRGSDPAGC